MGWRFNRQTAYVPRRATVAGLFSGLLAFTVALSGWAAGSEIRSLDYRKGGTLTIGGNGAIAKPEMEVMPTGSGKKPALMIMLNFNGSSGDAKSLQETANRIFLEHVREIKRFVVGEEPGAVGQGGFQIVLEVFPDSENVQPALRRLPDGRWQVAMDGAFDVRPVPVANMPFVNSVQVNPAPAQVSEMKLKPQSEPQAAVRKEVEKPAKTIVNALNKEAARGKEDPDVLIAARLEIHNLAQELQQVINERDKLEGEVFRLHQELAAKTPQLESLQGQVSQYDELIREFAPGVNDPRTRDAVVIDNLRKALIRLSVKLKATEKALETQIAKTKSLAGELAEAKNDPGILKDPSLVAMVMVEPDASDPAKPLQTAIKEARKTAVEAKKNFIYNPSQILAAKDGKVKAVLGDATFKEREIALKTAVREHPRNADAWLKLADLYAGRNDLKNAELALTGLLKEIPSRSEAYYYLALVYLGQKRPMEAKAALETYRRLHPEDVEDIKTLDAQITAAMSTASAKQPSKASKP